MFGKKAEKETGVTAAQIEKALGSNLRDLSDLTKQKIAENVVGAIRAKKIRSEINDADIRAIISITEMSVDQALTSVGSRVGKTAKDIVDR